MLGLSVAESQTCGCFGAALVSYTMQRAEKFVVRRDGSDLFIFYHLGRSLSAWIADV